MIWRAQAYLMDDDIVLKFPVPPTTNNLYVTRRDGKGRARTSEYAAWQREAQQLIMISGYPRQGWKHVRVEVRLPVNYQRDIDNIKPILDVLAAMHIVADDRWVDEWEVKRVAEGEACTVTVRRLAYG